MSTAAAIILAVGLLAVAAPGYLAISYIRRLAATDDRLNRFVPLSADGMTQTASEQILDNILNALEKVDPSLKALDRELRTFASNAWLIVVVEFIRLVFATLAAIAIGFATREAISSPLVHFGFCISAFLGVFVMTASLVKLVARSQRRKIVTEFFFAIDLIIIFLESGQSVMQALRSLATIGEKGTPHISPINQRLIADFAKGMAHERALGLWADRLGVEHAKDLAVFFVQSIVHGVELAPQLRRFADDLAERRLLAARESVGSKAARLTVVMVVFFLPAILIVLGGPPVATLMQSLKGLQ